jgi:bacillopeptidase F (M6 metalloprotease family)
LTGSSGGEIVKENFDAKAYAGQRVYLALRYVTDRSTIEDGVRFYGMELDGVSVADATDVSTWNSSDEIFPVPVEMWHVTLVAYTPDGGVVWANSLPLENNKVTLDATDFKSLIGTDASVVSAVVTVIESSATIVEYALYELYANSSLQPGGI